MNRKDSNSKHIIVDYESQNDPLAEAFRMLRLQVQTDMYRCEEKKGRVILITSSVAQEGKTTIVSNLAQMCAIAQIRTLVIDADLRKPTIHRFFEVPREPGITDALLSDVSNDLPIVETLVPNLSVLPAGKYTKHTTEVLGSPSFGQLLKVLRDKYDLIFLDSPPAGVVSDVGVLVRQVDAIYLVIHAGITKVRTVKQVVKTMKDLQGNIFGSIMSRINPRRDRYYYYHYYPQYYSTYYKDIGSGKK